MSLALVQMSSFGIIFWSFSTCVIDALDYCMHVITLHCRYIVAQHNHHEYKKELISQGINELSRERLGKYSQRYDEILEQGIEENKTYLILSSPTKQAITKDKKGFVLSTPNEDSALQTIKLEKLSGAWRIKSRATENQFAYRLANDKLVFGELNGSDEAQFFRIEQVYDFCIDF